MPMIVAGGASITVAGLATSLPKFGEPCWSSIMSTWVMPAL